jgi:hypothetical protein
MARPSLALTAEKDRPLEGEVLKVWVNEATRARLGRDVVVMVFKARLEDELEVMVTATEAASAATVALVVIGVGDGTWVLVSDIKHDAQPAGGGSSPLGKQPARSPEATNPSLTMKPSR